MQSGSGFDTCSRAAGKYKMNDDAEGVGGCLECPAGEQQGTSADQTNAHNAEAPASVITNVAAFYARYV